MAEIRRGYGGDAPRAGERLPWLEPVEDEHEPEPGGGGALALVGLVLLVLAALAAGGFMIYRSWSVGPADGGQIIRAPAGPYKVRPADPGGLRIDANGAVAEHTGTGGDIDAPLDLTAMPERPVTGPGSEPDSTEPIRPAASGPPPAAASPPARTVPPMRQPTTARLAPPPASQPPALQPAPAPVALAGGGTIQLGALASEAKAKAVWKAMSGRFSFLAPLAMSITPVKVGDGILYRLRASGGDAGNICARLKVAGEACTVVGG